MPKLQHQKQEKFATYLANGYSQMAAYREAGYACKNASAAANASKLANAIEIIERVEELKMRAADKEAASVAPPLPRKRKDGDVEIDLDWINREYISFLNIAKENSDLKNAATLLKDLAEINKIRPEKSEENNNNRMLPSNDKRNQLGTTVNISLLDPQSQKDGRGLNGPLEITLPDADWLPVSNHGPDEDS